MSEYGFIYTVAAHIVTDEALTTAERERLRLAVERAMKRAGYDADTYVTVDAPEED